MDLSLSPPLYVMAKPAGAACNLRCRYCYYLEKAHLTTSQPHNLTTSQPHTMSDELLRLFIQQYVEAQPQPNVLFTWHGGEPLLRPLAFYRRVVELQAPYLRQGYHIDNCLQTNGTLLDDEWCRFFAEQGWLVGISIDGTEAMHDAYRLSAGGQPTWRQVMHGIELLQQYGVEWNAMAVVHHQNADHPEEFYRFMRSIGCQYLQFAPIVERSLAHPDGRHLASPDEFTDTEGRPLSMTPESVTPQQWGAFLCRLFDEWVHHDVGEVFVELFDCTLANWCGIAPGICTLAEECSHGGVMEWNGDLYSCDHYVFPQYHLGNIRQHTLTEMLYSPRQEQFCRRKHETLPHQCQDCRWLHVCHGECPKNRILRTTDGEPGLNYLCEGYRQFFTHVAPYMDFMKAELEAGRAPANVMNWCQSS